MGIGMDMGTRPVLVNEVAVIVTKQEARRILARAVVSVGRAADPLAEFKVWEQSIAEAMSALGRDFDPSGFLRNCGIAATSVSSPEGHDSLPEAAKEHLQALLARDFGIEGGLEIIEVRGGPLEGYSLRYRAGGEVRRGFLIDVAGDWVCAPGEIGREDAEGALRGFLRHFDLTFAVGLHLRGLDDDEIDGVRAAIRPERVLGADEEDPRGLVHSYPLVFQLSNPLGNSRKFYCGYDPITEAYEAYDVD